MRAARRKRSEEKTRRRRDGKPSRRTAGRRSGKGTGGTRLRGETKKRSTIRGPASGGQAERISANETVVYGLVAYEDWDREERDRVQQLLTGDLTDLRRAIEAHAPEKPWTAVALGLACAAIAELRGSLR